MRLFKIAICVSALMISSSLSALSLRVENLTPDGWFILVEVREGGKVQVLANSFIAPWKENLQKIAASAGQTIYVSVHKTRNINDNREHNRKPLKLKATDGKKLAITAGQNGEPKLRLF